MAGFAEENINFGDGQTNTSPPPEAVMRNGFTPPTGNGGRGMPLAAPWLNWLLRELFRGLGLDKVTNSSGRGLFPIQNTMIRLEAIDRDNPNNFLVATGFKQTGMHVLKVIASSGLTLGTPTLNGDQPVIGGLDVQVVGYSRKFSDS